MLVLDDRADLPGERRIRPALAVVVAGLGQVPEVVDDAGADERVAFGRRRRRPRGCWSPRRRAGTRCVLGWMRNRAQVNSNVLAARCLTCAVVEDAVEAVEPAVGAPGQRVGQLVRVVAAEAGDDDLAACRPCRRRRCPCRNRMSGELATQTPPWPTAMPRGDVQPLGEDGDLVDLAVAVGVFQDLDAVAARAGGLARVFEALGDPDAAPLVERHRDRVDDVRLARDELDREPRRDRHLLRSPPAATARARAACPGRGGPCAKVSELGTASTSSEQGNPAAARVGHGRHFTDARLRGNPAVNAADFTSPRAVRRRARAYNPVPNERATRRAFRT